MLHTHGLGWEKNSSGGGLDKRESGYPYNAPGDAMGGSTAAGTASGTGDEDLDEADGIDVTGLPF